MTIQRKVRSLTRSEIMRRVGRRDTGPELSLRRALHAHGLRFRIERRVEGVKADIVFTAARVAIFVDGCFWHSCPIHGTKPGSNTGYWLPKLTTNAQRDLRQTARIEAAGWAVVRVWEHDCKDACPATAERVARLVRKRLRRPRAAHKP